MAAATTSCGSAWQQWQRRGSGCHGLGGSGHGNGFANKYFGKKRRTDDLSSQ
jgi:hypothetical protein